jgi:hypothetical protein
MKQSNSSTKMAKPVLTLAKVGPDGLSEEKLILLFEKLTGRRPTLAEIETVRAQRANRTGAAKTEGDGKLLSRYFYVDHDGNQYRGLTEHGIIDDQLNGSIWMPALGDRRKVLRDGTYIDDPLEAGPQRTPEELEFIADMERLKGHKLSEQEANLCVAQAKYLGEL